MITKNVITDKRTYSSPQIVLVKLDYKISLTLGSGEVVNPPIEPIGMSPLYFNDDPFISIMD